MVESSLEVREEFIGFVHWSEGLTGKGLSNVILKRIKELEFSAFIRQSVVMFSVVPFCNVVS